MLVKKHFTITADQRVAQKLVSFSNYEVVTYLCAKTERNLLTLCLKDRKHLKTVYLILQDIMFILLTVSETEELACCHLKTNFSLVSVSHTERGQKHCCCVSVGSL